MGLVVVSHSRALARAAVALALEMVAGSDLRIEVAAGLDETTFGTDAVAIQQAIEAVDGPAGVVVLMDLGSAVLSASLALDLLDDPLVRERVTLSSAPLVEGLVVACVSAAGGASRLEVAAEASDALLGKESQLAPAPDTAVVAPVPAEVVATFVVTNPHGLHARPAARLVSVARGFDATVSLVNLTTGAGPVPAGSLSRVATLGALSGHEVSVTASGHEAREAVDALVALAGRGFDEVPEAPVAVPAGSGPMPGSPGIGIGPARHLTTIVVAADDVAVGSAADEWQRVLTALAVVRADVSRVRAVTTREAGAEAAGIFDAHLALLDDDDLLADVQGRIADGAVAAWSAGVGDVEKSWAGLADPYLRERAADVRAVGDQVLRALTGATAMGVTASGVLIARDLSPAEAAGLDPSLVAGVVLSAGSASSHAAILARARDIPMVVGAGAELLTVAEGTMVVLDGGTGVVHVDPSDQVLAEFRLLASDLASRRVLELAAASRPAVSRDGTRFAVSANLGSAADARAAVRAGAEGAGLVRTEFLFLDRSTAPDIDEQEAEYEAIGAAMDGRRVTLRTLDVGGDKPLAYLPMPAEDNPFLGVRGLRLGLVRRDLLRDQLVAICRVAHRWPTSVMFPMVTTLGELLEAREMLVEAAGSSGLPADLRVGMMVEVPAAALRMATFVPHLDFVSIGTNDLTQYTLAAERGNPAVAGISDALDPGVLQLIRTVVVACGGEASVSVCGEAAADEQAIAVLVGLGVRDLSVTPAAVPRVKATLRDLDVERCVAVAAEALTMAGPEDVRKLVLTM